MSVADHINNRSIRLEFSKGGPPESGKCEKNSRTKGFPPSKRPTAGCIDMSRELTITRWASLITTSIEPRTSTPARPSARSPVIIRQCPSLCRERFWWNFTVVFWLEARCHKCNDDQWYVAVWSDERGDFIWSGPFRRSAGNYDLMICCFNPAIMEG